MKVRLVIERCNATMAANVGSGSVERVVKTFTIDIPDEAVTMLTPDMYQHGNVVGIELADGSPR